MTKYKDISRLARETARSITSRRFHVPDTRGYEKKNVKISLVPGTKVL